MVKRINGRNITHIDTDTGEVICETQECVKISDGEAKKTEYEKSHVMDFNQKEAFVKLFIESVTVMAKVLTSKEFTVAISLAKFVDYETCILTTGYGKSKHAMSLMELSDELEIEYTRLTRIIAVLIKRGIVGEMKVGNRMSNKTQKIYVVNPYIYINGKNPDCTVYEFFHKSNWKELMQNETCDG